MRDFGFLTFRVGDLVRFTYTNWKGRKGVRTCRFESLGVHDVYGDGRVCFVLNGYDVDKGYARRSYRVVKIEADTVEILEKGNGYCVNAVMGVTT